MSEKSIDNEELTAFVTSTLNGIARGVESAASETRKFRVPGKVEFEVAVTATKTNEVGGGLKLQVFNAAGKQASHGETVSRVKFEVTSESKNVRQRIDYGDGDNWKTA